MTIEELVREAGSQRKLAKRLNYSHAHVNRIVRVESRPSFEFMERVWLEFGVQLDISAHLEAFPSRRAS